MLDLYIRDLPRSGDNDLSRVYIDSTCRMIIKYISEKTDRNQMWLAGGVFRSILTNKKIEDYNVFLKVGILDKVFLRTLLVMVLR